MFNDIIDCAYKTQRLSNVADGQIKLKYLKYVCRRHSSTRT